MAAISTLDAAEPLRKEIAFFAAIVLPVWIDTTLLCVAVVNVSRQRCWHINAETR